MNPKFKTLVWWAISIWFVIWWFMYVMILASRPIPPINYVILFAGFCLMIYCARYEDKLFPDEPEGEEENA